jgi:hypothetical protein
MNVFRLRRNLEVDKRHVLLSPEAKVSHERLQNGLSLRVAPSQRPGDNGVEDLGLFYTAGDAQEL